MVAVIKDAILQLCLDGKKSWDQCYDGCSIMMEKRKELQLN